MEEITEYRVTRHAGCTTVAAGTLLYTTEHEDVAWRFYNRHGAFTICSGRRLERRSHCGLRQAN